MRRVLETKISLLVLSGILLVAGCQTPVPQPNAKETPAEASERDRLTALKAENVRLHEALFKTKQAIEQTRIEAEKCKTELTAIRENKKHEVIELPPAIDPEPVAKQRIQMPPPCQFQLQLNVKKPSPDDLKVFENRLQGWGLERIQILRGREVDSFDVFYNGFPEDGKLGAQTLESPGILSVHQIETLGLTPFMTDEFYRQFRTLFPEEAGRINWIQPPDGPSFATSPNASDIETLAKQVAYKAPHLLLLPGPAETRGLWRSWTIKGQPVFTHKNLQEVATSRDEDGTALLLKFKRHDTGLPSPDRSVEKLPLAFVIDGRIIRTRSLPDTKHKGIRTAELRLPHLSDELERKEIQRLATVLRTPFPAHLASKGVQIVTEQCPQ